MRTFIKLLMLSSLCLLLLAFWRRDALPQPGELASELLNEPVQTQISQSAFATTVGGVNYKVQPLYDYDLVGLVVSKHNADSWLDYLHREANDHLNVVDLCVVWGNNVRNSAYLDLTYSSGQFTCYVQANSAQAYAAFDPTALSNNHLLTDKAELAKIMKKVEIGDQIHFRGRLSEYSHNHGFAFKRGTSIVRTDTGNGACETVFIDSFDILKKNSHLWRNLAWLAALLLLASIVAWFMQPVRFDRMHR